MGPCDAETTRYIFQVDPVVCHTPTSRPPDGLLMTSTLHDVRPLGCYVQGSLRLLTTAGLHSVRTDEHTAHQLKRTLEGPGLSGSPRGDFLTSTVAGFEALHWIADSRQPSPESRTDALLRQNLGPLFANGWLNALLQLAPENACYSPAGLEAWRQAGLVLLEVRWRLGEEDRGEILKQQAAQLSGVADPTERPTGCP